MVRPANGHLRMMDGGIREREARRFRIGYGRSRSGVTVRNQMLPIRRTPTNQDISNSVSCWYCDFKILAFNDLLFRFGERTARYLKAWFSVGVGFTLTSLLVVVLMLLWELAAAVHLLGSIAGFSNYLIGLPSSVSGLSVSFADAGYIILSTLISVCLHEFGHAIAAASEGLKIEYIAVFIAILFPGALVAFDHDKLHGLHHFSALRIYCAGIWHNAVTCAICGLMMLFLPMFLFPLYRYGEHPMVLDVPYSSPLYGYLSPGDVIVSLDGISIHDPQDWIKVTSLIDGVALQDPIYANTTAGFGAFNGKKGYCIPNVLIEESISMLPMGNLSSCPYDLTGFISSPCLDTSILINHLIEDDDTDGRKGVNCLNASEVVNFKKCGTGWLNFVIDGSNCFCSQGESCLAPIQTSSSTWVEIKYSSPFSVNCLNAIQSLGPNSSIPQSSELACDGSFVFVGDMMSLAHSILLSAYQPRWTSGVGASLPNVLEKLLMCTFHVSLVLAFLNILPVFLLDGESIVELCLRYTAFLSLRKRKKVLRVILFTGTFTSIIAFFRVVSFTFL